MLLPGCRVGIRMAFRSLSIGLTGFSASSSMWSKFKVRIGLLGALRRHKILVRSLGTLRRRVQDALVIVQIYMLAQEASTIEMRAH